MIGAEPLPDRIGDHVVADVALERARRRIGGAQDLLADDQHQVAEAEQRGEDQQPGQRRPHRKAAAGDAQQAGADRRRCGSRCPVDVAADLDRQQQRQDRDGGGDDAEPDHRQAELDRAIARGHAHDGDHRLLEHRRGHQGEDEAIVHRRVGRPGLRRGIEAGRACARGSYTSSDRRCRATLPCKCGPLPMPDDDVAKALQDALAVRFGERLPVDDEPERACRARRHRRAPHPPALSAAAGVAPSSCGCCAPARCRRRRRATCSRATSWSCATPRSATRSRRRFPTIPGSARRRRSWCSSPTAGASRSYRICAASRSRTITSTCSSTRCPNCSIVLATFIRAAEAVGLGCCPISAIRDHAAFVSDLLRLPERVVPVAGMCVGWPSERGYISPRLGLDATVHIDRYSERDLAADIDAYDRRRNEGRPPWKQRNPRALGRSGVLRLVGGQGAPICRAAARGLRRLRAEEGI